MPTSKEVEVALIAVQTERVMLRIGQVTAMDRQGGGPDSKAIDRLREAQHRATLAAVRSIDAEGHLTYLPHLTHLDLDKLKKGERSGMSFAGFAALNRQHVEIVRALDATNADLWRIIDKQGAEILALKSATEKQESRFVIYNKHGEEKWLPANTHQQEAVSSLAHATKFGLFSGPYEMRRVLVQEIP